MSRVYNFSAGPSVLPESVLERAASEMLDCNGSGQSVMEMSHRSKEFDAIIKGTEQKLRQVLNIIIKFFLYKAALHLNLLWFLLIL